MRTDLTVDLFLGLSLFMGNSILAYGPCRLGQNPGRFGAILGQQALPSITLNLPQVA